MKHLLHNGEGMTRREYMLALALVLALATLVILGFHQRDVAISQTEQLCSSICNPTQYILNSTGCYCNTPYQGHGAQQNTTYYNMQQWVKTT